MGAAQEMPAGFDLAEGIERLGIRGHVDAARHHVHHAELVEIHDEFLVGRGEAALHPAGRVEDEIGAGEQRRQQRLRALVGGLGVGQLGRAERAAGAEGQAHAARELARAVDRERRLGRAEGRRA